MSRIDPSSENPFIRYRRFLDEVAGVYAGKAALNLVNALQAAGFASPGPPTAGHRSPSR